MHVHRIRYGDSLAAVMASSPAVLIEGFPTHQNAPLLNAAAALGPLSLDGINSPSVQAQDSFVHLISVRTEPAIDPNGNQMLSTTNMATPLHTDEYFSKTPAKFVFMLCIRQSDTGGESTVASLTDIMSNLSDLTVRVLCEAAFPFEQGPVPILKKEDSSWSVRFNYLEIMRAAAKTGQVLSDIQKKSVIDLQNAANLHCERFRLSPGDCLVVNNFEILHGREAFPADSGRLLKRVRVK